MKIISGKYKGRVLKGFDIVGTRPTMDRIKESVFAMIQDYIKDSVSLDLFSGSGNLGIEALSEGGSYSYLVDSNNTAIRVINENVSSISIDPSSYCIKKSDFRDFLSVIDVKFDVIFLDPPYKSNYLKESLDLIEKRNLLNDDGIVVCESDSFDKIIYSSYYSSIKSRSYGDKCVVVLAKG